MGRHSAPEDAELPVASEVAGPVPAAPTDQARLRPAPTRLDATGKIAPLPGTGAAGTAASPDAAGTEAAGSDPGGTGKLKPEQPSQVRETPTRADLRLLRTDAGLRSRCAAGVLVPFLLYTVILVVISRADVFLIWVWIPLVSAGVIVGTFLDAAHRRADEQRTTQPGSGE